MKPIRLLALFLLSAVLFTSAAFAASPAAEDMRGVWVSSVYNLDYPSTQTTDAAVLKNQADAILNGAQAMGMNAIFLQVRPSSDALYPSDIFPWSAYLTGSQGTAPSGGFDPLAYFIEQSHARGMELHAWINPYRITKKGDAEFNALPASNPAKQNPGWVIKHSDNYYYNPGLPAVRKLVVDGVAEIIDRYPDIDGIHFDDYFYPDSDFDDAATYAQYGAGFSNLADWRRDNVNKLIDDVYTLVHQKNDSLVFGVSPSGVWANQSDHPRGSNTRGGNPSYSRAYADSVYWIENGMIDYIVPQIYWAIGSSAADYQILADWWSAVVRGTDVKLYIGEAAYKAGDSSQGAAWASQETELMKHLNLCKDNNAVSGHIYFRYGSFDTLPTLKSSLTQYHAANPVQQPQAPQEPENRLTPEELLDNLSEPSTILQTFTLIFYTIFH